MSVVAPHRATGSCGSPPPSPLSPLQTHPARHQDTVACPPNPAQASTTSSPSARGSAPAPWDNVLHIHTATQTCLTCAQSHSARRGRWSLGQTQLCPTLGELTLRQFCSNSASTQLQLRFNSALILPRIRFNSALILPRIRFNSALILPRIRFNSALILPRIRFNSALILPRIRFNSALILHRIRFNSALILPRIRFNSALILPRIRFNSALILPESALTLL